MWGRDCAHSLRCRDDIASELSDVEVICAPMASAVAAESRLVITCTAAREPLLNWSEIQPGTLIHAVGSDSPGKQELDPRILREAALLLVDSVAQCRRLGELQHALEEESRAVEIGAFVGTGPRDAVAVADFTGLGAEDLYIAECCWRKLKI